MFVVPSNNLAATSVFVTHSPISSALFGPGAYLTQDLTDSGGNITSVVLSKAFYVTNSGSGDHLYSLDLSDTSKTPVPAQVGSLVLNGSSDKSQAPCNVAAIEQTLNTPSSAILLVQTAGTDGRCYSSDDVVYLAHASDGSGTAPMATPIRITTVLAGFSSASSNAAASVWPVNDTAGNLSGLLYIDSSFNLTFSDAAFAHPTVLLANATTFTALYGQNGFLFIQATTLGGKTSLYRVAAGGSISQDLYDFQASNQVTQVSPDKGNGYLWIADNGGTFDTNQDETAYSINLARAPLNGGLPGQLIYSTSGTLPSGFQGFYMAYLVGVTGSSFVFDLQAFGVNTGSPSAPASIDTLAVTALPGTTPTVIASLTGGYYGGNQIVGSDLFMTVHTLDATSNETSIAFNEFDASGHVLKSIAKAQIAGTYTQVGGTPLSPILSTSTLYLAEGYTGTPPDLGGSTLYAMSLPTLAQTAVTNPAGSPYVLSSHESPNSYSDGPAVVAVQDYFSTSPAQAAAAFDAIHNIWALYTNPANTQQQPFDAGGGGF